MKKIIPLFLLVFVFIPLLGLQTNKLVIPYKTPNGKYNVGDTASNFTLPDVYGNEYPLYDYKGKIILLHVGPTW